MAGVGGQHIRGCRQVRGRGTLQPHGHGTHGDDESGQSDPTIPILCDANDAHRNSVCASHNLLATRGPPAPCVTPRALHHAHGTRAALGHGQRCKTACSAAPHRHADRLCPGDCRRDARCSFTLCITALPCESPRPVRHEAARPCGSQHFCSAGHPHSGGLGRPAHQER